MCCCDTSCNDDVMRKRVKDKELFLKESEADYTGTTEQCHFPQCSKDICPVDDCQLKWTDSCKGPRPVVYVADGHSGSRGAVLVCIAAVAFGAAGLARLYSDGAGSAAPSRRAR